MKKQNGITLISLAITIIVLLILSVVTISLVVGDNGVLTQTTDAVEKNRRAKAIEDVSVALASAESGYAQEWAQNADMNISEQDYIEDNLKEYLNKTGDLKKDPAYNREGKIALTYKPNGDNREYNLLIDTNGKISISDLFVSQITVENYGDYVDYGADLGITTAGKPLSGGETTKTDWRIFYSDGERVYLIASDYLPVTKFPPGVFGTNNGKYNGTWSQNSVDTTKLTTNGNITTHTEFMFSKLSNVTISNKNYQAVSTLLDTDKWNVFARDEDTAVIGSPTVEMWIASWNKKYNDKLLFNSNTTGYQIGKNGLGNHISDSAIQIGCEDTLYFPHYSESQSAWEGCFSYLLASPSAYSSDHMLRVYCKGTIEQTSYTSTNNSVRPVVSLPADIQAIQGEDGIWILGK